MREEKLSFVLGKRPWLFGLGFFLAVCAPALVLAEGDSEPTGVGARFEVTLDDALRSAFEHHPDLKAAYALVDGARGSLVGAKSYPFNPRFLALAGSRTGVVERSTDLAFELGQQVEIAGQRRRRMHMVESDIAAQRARWERSARLLAARVNVTFINAVEARQQLEVTEADVALTQRLLGFAQKRLDHGATTLLEVNLAATEFGRSQGRAQRAEGVLLVARTQLAQAMAVDPVSPPVPVGDLDMPRAPLPPLAELAASAQDNRADLEAFRALERRSNAQLRLARSQGAPDLVARGFWAREGPEKIIGGGGTISVPIFQRNQGPIAETRATVSRTRAERESAELAAEQEIAGAYARYLAAVSTAERLQETVVGSLQKNLDLLQKALEAGKTTWPEVLIIRRSLIDARREHVTAQAEAGRAWIQLQLAAGQIPVPRASEERLQ